MDDAIAEVAAIRARLAAVEDAFAPKPATDTASEEHRSAIVAAATSARFRNPEIAARILAGREGDPAELLAELAEAEPYLTEPGHERAASRRGSREVAPGPCSSF